MNNENCNDTFERNSKVNIAKEIAERGDDAGSMSIVGVKNPKK